MEKAKPKIQCKNVIPSSHTTENLSRYELLRWINESLGLKLKEVEALRTGSIYCQLMDKLFPGSVSLKQVKLHATVQYEYILNFKQLQNAFRAVGCEKDVPIEKLIKGRFQENFEFLQWFKRFFDANSETEFMTSLIQSEKKKTKTNFPAHPIGQVASSSSKQKEKELKSQLVELKERAGVLEKERNFYYSKLKDIEVLCTGEGSEAATESDKDTLISKILAELYATEDEEDAPADQTF